MANRLLYVRWAAAKVGRERQAMGLFQKSLEYYSMLQRDGIIESFEPSIIAAYGGDLGGFIILRGEAEKLAEVRRQDT